MHYWQFMFYSYLFIYLLFIYLFIYLLLVIFTYGFYLLTALKKKNPY